MDGRGSDGPPSVVSDQGFAGGVAASASCAPASMSFFLPLDNRRKEHKVAVWRWDVGCGAARSRSHRLSLALPWQLVEPGWRALSIGSRSGRARIRGVGKGERKERERSATGKKGRRDAPRQTHDAESTLVLRLCQIWGKLRAWTFPPAAGRHSLTAPRNNNNAAPLQHICLGLGSNPIRRASCLNLASLAQQSPKVMGFSSVAFKLFSISILPWKRGLSQRIPGFF